MGDCKKRGGSVRGEASTKKKIPPRPRGGRKSEYRSVYCQELWKYFMSYEGRGIPQMSEFARQIGVDVRTLRNWRLMHEDFDDIYEICMDYQQELLNNGGLTAMMNPRMVQFLLSSNHKVREYTRIKAEERREEVEMSSADRQLMLAIEDRLMRGPIEEPSVPEDMMNEGAIPPEDADDE